jgi:hypothetical protein
MWPIKFEYANFGLDFLVHVASIKLRGLHGRTRNIENLSNISTTPEKVREESLKMAGFKEIVIVWFVVLYILAVSCQGSKEGKLMWFPYSVSLAFRLPFTEA